MRTEAQVPSIEPAQANAVKLQSYRFALWAHENGRPGRPSILCSFMAR